MRLEDENGELLSVCGVGTRMQHIQKVFTEVQDNHKVNINFVDKNGLVQIDTNDTDIENEYLDLSVLEPIEGGISVFFFGRQQGTDGIQIC